MTREDIENAGRIEREKVIKELQDGYNKHHDINHYTIATSTVDKYALPLFMAGVEWFRKSLFHKTKNEVPKAIGEYANDIYPQIPCLVQGKLSTGEGYGVRYWNVECQVWDDEECDDYECDKDDVEEWAYLDDIVGNMEE